MKKTISWVSAAVLGLSLLIPANITHAWGPIASNADNTDLSNGGTVTITCDIAENSGYNGFDITITYPENKLTVVNSETGGIYEKAYVKSTKDKPGEIGVIVLDKEDITAAEDVFKVTFEAVSGASGSAIINVNGNCSKADMSTTDFGQVFTITLPEGDGTVDTSTPKPVATTAPRTNTGGGGGGGSSAPAKTSAPDGSTEAPTAEAEATAVPTAAPTPKPTTDPAALAAVNFTDLNGHWAADSIKELAAKGYINGFDDNTFRPEENVTRAQFIKMLVEVKGLNTSMALDVFDDVPSEAWFASYVTAAAADGIVKGDDENSFHPDSPITRQEMAVMCARAFGFTSDNALEFADTADVADWAKDSVSALVSENIINGFEEDNTFRPLNNTSRAQAAVVLKRITDR